ncbi:MAG: tyrosine-protein phosphatase [Candidatus Paralactobacillus gallistercoris]|uniref:Tyrosine-protein phosphatase n=1 Tax=Candidatus Paralactobacillus gallistercoris TaxID=2838724 RepID=A0A948WZC8_9LACO|nr:tyrosine-protein phosphatase [Candidatus Paralactobacillus gallistercoris]
MQRILPIKDGNNFRELGGYETTDGKTIKTHKVIRSGALNNLKSDDLAYLAKYGVKYDVDFRSNEECREKPDNLPSGTTYYWDPVLHFDEMDNTDTLATLQNDFAQNKHIGYEHMISVYHNMIKKPDANQAYRKFFDYLLMNDQPRQCLLFHCTSGKDRTGIGAILLLSALGVPENVIKQDYLLSNQTIQSVLTPLLQQVQQKSHNNETLITNIRNLLTVSEDYYQTAMDDIRDMSGNVINYLHEVIKVTDDEIEQLRQIYLM